MADADAEPGVVADSGRDEPGSVTCDWLLGVTLEVRGGSDAELEGACVDEGCRRSFIDEGLGADAPVVVADCDGRGAEDGAGFEDGDELEEGVVELRYPPVAELLLGSLSNEPKSYVDISPPYRSSSAA
ncbi:hypothetical protein [Botrimarina mediterranea]|uniref:Uncharacterized protein n=1 Tax=Botrimarina mediterranea TaxID=2528022 RepID=A0A518KAU7_9BACT|nr:hypothetical protein [Botrimarina mediterranea]QDV74909.1 hypothetical protein Spa11_31180 [Botrimarina mediterranea]